RAGDCRLAAARRCPECDTRSRNTGGAHEEPGRHRSCHQREPGGARAGAGEHAGAGKPARCAGDEGRAAAGYRRACKRLGLDARGRARCRKGTESMSYAARVVVAALAGVILALPAAAQNEITERFSKTAHLDQNGTFDLTNVTGDIVITGTTGRDVTIEAVKRVQRPNPRAARLLLAMIDIQVTEQANRLEVRTIVPRPRNFPGSVDFTVTVPEDASVIVKTITGSIRASNVKGELRADTVAGSIA